MHLVRLGAMPTTKPPIGFTNLEDARTRVNKDLNVIGVVSDFLPPIKSRGEGAFGFCLLDSGLRFFWLMSVFQTTCVLSPYVTCLLVLDSWSKYSDRL